VDPVIKFVPVTVMVNAGSPAVTLAGEIELIVGTGLLTTPPPGLTVEDLLQEKIVPISKMARNDFEIFISSRFLLLWGQNYTLNPTTACLHTLTIC
jgi:hypothetical protein